MKIAIAHNFYRERGGEDAVVEREVGLLASGGHEVVTFYEHSHERLGHANLTQKVRTALSLTFNEASYRSFQAFLRSEKPDVVHTHNTFPLLTPAVLRAAHDEGIPTVQTLHNFRYICANGLFLRAGRPCERCLGGSPLQGLWFACYRNSRSQTAPLTTFVYRYDRGRRLAPLADRIIVLSDFSREKFLEAGIPSDQVTVKPNFYEDPGEPPPWAEREDFALYVGRLSEEKGIGTLMQASKRTSLRIKVVGNGPLEDWARKAAGPKVEFMGTADAAGVRNLMRAARTLIIPSICYENFPLVLAEAWANGLPVVASGIGSLKSLVKDREDGILFKAGDSTELAAALESIASGGLDLEFLARNGRRAYTAKLTPKANLAYLEEIYAQACRHFAGRRKT